jgi:type I restriction enzyme S subunit
MAEPKVRFKKDDGSSYPAWRTIPMSEVFTEISEKNHPELPVLSVQQGVGTVLRDSSDRNILYDKSNLKNYKAMKKDDYIIHLRSFEGGLECSNYDGISSPAYRILRSQAILPAAYRDYFRSYEFIHNKLAVSVVGIRDGKNIDMDTFWQIPMSIPCIEEQQKIAVFLSSVDAVITASEEEVANLETQKKAVMKKILSQEVRFKRADGSDFPEWEEKKLGEIADIVGGGTPDTSVEDYWVNGDVEWFTPTEVGHEKYVGSSKRKISQLGFAKSSARKLPAGTLLLTSRATIGEMSIAEKECCTNQGFQSLIVHDGVDNEFIYYCQPIIQKYGLKHAAGSTFLEISGTNMGKCPLKIPCLEEQRLIADSLSDFDEAIVTAKKELELWKRLKKGLLQQMFV